MSGAWSWERQTTTLVSGGVGEAPHLEPRQPLHRDARRPAQAAEGSDGATPAGGSSSPSTRRGAHRWLEIGRGTRGGCMLGQTGMLGGWPPGGSSPGGPPSRPAPGTRSPSGSPRTRPSRSASTGKDVFTAAAAPLAPGQVGFAARGGAVEVDKFTFIADPDGEPCRECHAGEFASRKARTLRRARTSTPSGTAGGGTPARRGAAAAAGGPRRPRRRAGERLHPHEGLPRLRQPRPEDHRNGTREGRGNRSVNSFHLRSGCHRRAAAQSLERAGRHRHLTSATTPAIGRNHRHGNYPADAAVELGQGQTRDGESLASPSTATSRRGRRRQAGLRSLHLLPQPPRDGVPDNVNRRT